VPSDVAVRRILRRIEWEKEEQGDEYYPTCFTSEPDEDPDYDEEAARDFARRLHDFFHPPEDDDDHALVVGPPTGWGR
jgi:hypothetical protein